MTSEELIRKLKSLANPKNVKGMARFGINIKNTLGISVTTLRKLAKEIKKEVRESEKLHKIAANLWRSGIHEARMLSAIIDDPKLVTEKQMEEWVVGIDSWDVCDGVCGELFDKTPFAFRKVAEWIKRDEEFVKRSAFSMLAWLAVHDKQTADAKFIKFLPKIKKASADERNFVKKAVNWALRQIGKRNKNLNKAAIVTAEEIKKINSKSARWIASNALSELQSNAVQNRLNTK